MITFRGTVFIATAFFTFLLARLTQVGWLYLLDAMFWGMILVSFALPWLAVMSLSAHRRLVRAEAPAGSPGPAEGESVQVELWLENGRAWPRHLLSVEYQCPLAGPADVHQRFFVPRLDGGISLALVSTVQCQRRGLHYLGPVTVESRAPFGFFRRRRRLPSPLSVLVYPRVYPLNRLPLLEGIQGTETRPRKSREGQEIAGSRHYFPGDPMRHVHWRNTARSGRPMVKEFEDTQENTLVIAFDSSRDVGQGQESTLEYSIKLAASVAGYMVNRGQSVRVATGRLPGQDIPWNLLLKELALLESGPGPSLPALVETLPPGARVLALVSEADAQGLETLSRRAGQISGLAVVALEAFGNGMADETPGSGDGIDALRRAGVPIVRCHPGELLQTLRSLEQVQWSARTEMQGTQLPRRRE